MLTPRWTPMRAHSVQTDLCRSKARFKVVPAGRRSGKTERAKRESVKMALRSNHWPDYRVGFGAPTWSQAKAIYWSDLKALVPKPLVKDVSESELVITLVNGAQMHVTGLDRPERAEGRPWNHFVLDEYGNMREETWPAHIRPALSDRYGSAWLIGVPEGRNHYYAMWKKALADQTGEWAGFTWHSADILPDSEIQQAKEDLDELTFKQEYEADFVNFEGQCYYPFHEQLHTRWRLPYNEYQPLVLCFDFNVEPGTASIIQELPHPGLADRIVTGVIGEVWIPRNSNTIAVCNKIIQMYSSHAGEVYVYGDATGGSRGTAQTMGSDWDIIKAMLRPIFGNRLQFRVPRQNPRERARINAVNSRLKSISGEVHLLVDPVHAPHVIEDFEGVRLLAGGSGEIDKKSDPSLTHLTDGIGYYIAQRFPVKKQGVTSMEWLL